MRLVADSIRSMNAREASRHLGFLSKRGARPIKKLLESALANAKKNFQIQDDNLLYVKEIRVNEGPVLKRYMPRAFGRASLIHKKTSHVTIVLEEKKNSISAIGNKKSVSKP